MRTLWCTLILGCRNLGFAFAERDAHPTVHTHSGLRKPRFCIRRTRCEPYRAQSFWVAETSVLHTQNEMRTLWCTLMLGCRNLGFAFAERDANPMVHTHSGLPKPRFCIRRTRCEPYVMLGCPNVSFAFSKRDANPAPKLRQAGVGGGRCRHATRGLSACACARSGKCKGALAPLSRAQPALPHPARPRGFVPNAGVPQPPKPLSLIHI